MKQVLFKVFSLLRNFFLSLRVHLHVGFWREEIPEIKDKNDDLDED